MRSIRSRRWRRRRRDRRHASSFRDLFRKQVTQQLAAVGIERLPFLCRECELHDRAGRQIVEWTVGEAAGQFAQARIVAKQHDVDIIVVEAARRSEEHTSELQPLMRISYAVFCLKKKKHTNYDRHTSYE